MMLFMKCGKLKHPLKHAFFACSIRSLHAAFVLCMPDPASALLSTTNYYYRRKRSFRHASIFWMPHTLSGYRISSLHAEASVLWMPKHPFKHAFFACRMPPIPAEAAPTPPCPLMTNYLVSRLSFFIRRLSSVIRRHNIRSSSFHYYFLLKNIFIEPTHGAPHAPNQRTMGSY